MAQANIKDLQEQRQQEERVRRGRALMAYHRKLALELSATKIRFTPKSKN